MPEAPAGQLAGANQQPGALAVVFEQRRFPDLRNSRKPSLIMPETTRSGRPSLSKSRKSTPIPAIGAPSSRKRHAGLEADLLKRPVALIVEEEIAHRIVGDEDVREAVAIQIGERDAHAFADVRAIPDSCDTSVKVPS